MWGRETLDSETPLSHTGCGQWEEQSLPSIPVGQANSSAMQFISQLCKDHPCGAYYRLKAEINLKVAWPNLTIEAAVGILLCLEFVSVVHFYG